MLFCTIVVNGLKFIFRYGDTGVSGGCGFLVPQGGNF